MCLNELKGELNFYTQIINENKFLNPLNGILQKLREKVENKILQIAIVGEFSSGKTSAINSLFNINLPVNITPETATIWKIVLRKNGNNEKTMFKVYLRNGNIVEYETIEDVKKIDPKEINEIVAFPKKIDTWMDEDLIIIDTPGLSSLDENHFKVLIDFISEADILLVFVDISQGSLTNSTMDFLKKNIQNKKKTFLVYTKADKKNPSAREEVRKYALKEFSNLVEDIAIISSRKKELSELKEIFIKISKEKEEILCENIKLELKNFCKNVVPILEQQIQSQNLSLDDIKLEEEKLKEELYKIETQINNIEKELKRKFEMITLKTKTKFQNYLLAYKDKIMEALYDENLEEGIEDRFKIVVNEALVDSISFLENEIKDTIGESSLELNNFGVNFKGDIFINTAKLLVNFREYISKALLKLIKKTLKKELPEITGEILTKVILFISKTKVEEQINKNIYQVSDEFYQHLKTSLSKELEESLRKQKNEFIALRDTYLKSLNSLKEEKSKKEEEFTNYLNNLKELKEKFERCSN